MLLNGHWEFPEKMGDKKYVGFIYVIFDNYMKKAYIGKKLFRGTGKLNRGKESNWKKYISSSKFVQTNIGGRPIEEFEFICIEQYRTKGTLSYAETWSLCMVEAPTSNIWMNKLIGKVSWNVSESISDRHRQRLNQIVERL